MAREDPSKKKERKDSTMDVLLDELEEEVAQAPTRAYPAVHPSAPPPPTQKHPVSGLPPPPPRPGRGRSAPPPPPPPSAKRSHPPPPPAGPPSAKRSQPPPPPPPSERPRSVPPPLPGRRAPGPDPLAEHAAAIVKACEAELGAEPTPTRASRLHYEIARLHEAPLRDLRRAAAHYQEALALAPEHLPTIQGARRTLIGRKNYQAALPLFDAEARITRDPARKAALYLQKGRLLEDVLGSRDEARSAYQTALELDRADPAILKALEQCHLETRSWEELDRTLERSANAVSTDPRHRAALVVQRAQLVEQRPDEVERAIELYETALRLDPGAPGALEALKRLHHGRKRWRDLIRVLTIEAEQTNDARVATMALYRIGRLHAERLGNQDEALGALERAARASPDDPMILDELARLYEDSERYAALAEVLTRLVRVTRDADTRLGLLHRIGQLFEERLDREDDAIHFYESALKVSATYVPALQALGRLYKARQAWEPLIGMHLAEVEASTDPRRRAAGLSLVADVFEMELDRREDAAEHHARALGFVPGYPPSFSALTRLLSEAGRWRELVELYERAVDQQRGPRAVAYLFKIGAIYEDHLGEPVQAAHAYRRILELDADHLGAIHALQRATARAKRFDELVEALELEVDKVDDDAQIVALLHRAGEVLDHELGDRDGALARYRRVLNIDAEYVPALASLGRLYYRSGRWEDLLDVYRRELALTPHAESVPLLQKMAELCEVRIGRDDEAIEYYRRAVDVDPTHGAALSALSRKLRERGRWEELVKTLELELRGSTDKRAIARTAYRIGEVYEDRLDQTERAVKAYEQAVAAAPDHRPAVDALARLRAGQQAWSALVADLDREATTTADPSLAMAARLRQGDIFARDLGDARRAIECYDRVVEQEPDNLLALMALEQLHRKVGNWEQLAGIYGSLARVQQDPGARVAALFELARVQRQRSVGDDADLRATYEAILSIVPHHPSALSALEQLALDRLDRHALAEVDGRLTSSVTDPAALAAHHLRLAESLEAMGDPASLECYRRALGEDPESIGATRGLSRVAQRLNDPAALAEAARREAAVAHDGEAAARLLVRSARVRMERLGDHEGARSDLERALELCPDDSDAAHGLTEILDPRGEHARLADLLARAAASAERSERVAALWMQVAALQAERLDNVAGAIGSLNRVLRGAPNHVPTLRRLADLYARDAQWNEAVQLLGRVVQLAPDRDVLREAHLKLASIWDERLHETPRALVSLQAVLALDADNATALARLSDLQERDGKVQEAADSALRLVKAARQPEARAQALVRLARLEMRRGNDPAADEALLEAVALEGPGSESALECKARLHDPRGWQAYVKALHRYLPLARQAGVPTDGTHLEIARVLFDQLEHTEGALDALRKGIDGGDGSASLRRELAMRLRMAGRNEEAVRELRELLEMDLTLGDTWRDLSRTFDSMGRRVEARLALAPLVLLGVSTDKETQAVLSSPVTARPRAGAFDQPVLWSLGGYTRPERAAAELLLTLEPGLPKLYPPDLEAFGLSSRDRVTTKHPTPLRALADELADVFGIDDFELYVHRVRTRGVSVELGAVPAILVPSQVVDMPRAQQVFMLSQPLMNMGARLHPIDKLTPRELEVLLASASRAVAPGYGAGLTSEDFLDEQARRITKALGRKGRRTMEEAATRYVESDPVDFARWVEKVRRANHRLAALLTDDLAAAVDVVRKAERELAGLDGMSLARKSEVVADLLAFWISEPALQLRARAGLLSARAP